MAIVLPQGRFNNTSDERIREFIMDKARLLAVVWLDGNTFKPHTGTKTSVLFIQKRDEKTNPRLDDYEIFMAVSECSGKDNSGDEIYEVNDNGETTRTIKGGKKSLVNTVEASIPLSNAAKMRLAFFADYGMIGENSFDEIRRAGYGVSLEWYSPMGPINLVFARAKNAGELERTSSFEFTMGRKF